VAETKSRSFQSPQECHALAQRLRKLAQDQSLTPEYRAECLRHANNLRYVARIRAKQNGHPPHPTKQ
jgi:hypothetical protein